MTNEQLDAMASHALDSVGNCKFTYLSEASKERAREAMRYALSYGVDAKETQERHEKALADAVAVERQRITDICWYYLNGEAEEKVMYAIEVSENVDRPERKYDWNAE